MEAEGAAEVVEEVALGQCQPEQLPGKPGVLQLLHWSVPLLLALGDDGGGDAVQLQDGLMRRLELLKSKQSVAGDGEEAHQGRQPLPSPTGFPN